MTSLLVLLDYVIERQSETQKSMGREAPSRYPSQGPRLYKYQISMLSIYNI